MQINLLHDPLQSILFQAGELLLTYYGKMLSRQEKPDGSFFTRADVEVEQFLIKALRDIIPQASILAEESGISNDQSEYRWIIDPLDGTSNFVRNIPYFCISIALAYKDTVVLGAIYDPLHQEFYFTTIDSGAFCNGSVLRIHHSGVQPYLISLPSLADAPKLYIKLSQLGFHYSFRRFGALALDCAFIAAGRMDGVVGFEPKWWDIAAGALLIAQAGGKVTNQAGSAIDASSHIMIAGNSPVHANLIKFLQSED